MTPHLPDQNAWAARVGARLQMLQASFADDDPGARMGYVEEELTREMREIAPSSRVAFLAALAERFPDWGSAGENQGERVAAAAPPTPAPAPAAAPAPSKLASAESLITQLSALAAGLPEESRRNFAKRLQQAGFAISMKVASASGDEAPAELQKKLSLDPGQQLDRQRVLKLVAVLVDLVVTMDQLAWNMWKSLAPNSIVRRDPGATGDLKKIAGPYLTGDSEVSTAQITQLVDKTRQLIAGLLAAIGATGEGFARNFLTRFSPQHIKEQADADPGFFIGGEQKCWRKYNQIFYETTGVAIENEIANIIAKYTEDLILGAGRPQTESGS